MSDHELHNSKWRSSLEIAPYQAVTSISDQAEIFRNIILSLNNFTKSRNICEERLLTNIKNETLHIKIKNVLGLNCDSSFKMAGHLCDVFRHGFLRLMFLAIDFLRQIIYSDALLILVIIVFGLVLIMFIISTLWPLNYVKDLTDVGYDHLKKSWRGKSAAVNARIARARSARKAGNKLPPPYPNGWFAVAESTELKKEQVISVDCLGLNLAVYRCSDGTVRCMDAYCPHLGANMAIGGTVSGNCLECPFHRWRFNGDDGACVSVPGQDSPPRGVGVKTHFVREIDDVVWLWFDAGGCAPLWEPPAATQLAKGNKSWGFRGRNEYIISSHVQDIPENGADVAHLNAVHSRSLMTGENWRQSLQEAIGCHTWSAEWAAVGKESGEPHVAQMKLRHDYMLLNKIPLLGADITAHQIGPGHVRLNLETSLGPILIMQSVTPLAPMTQRVIHRVYSPLYNAPYATVFMLGECFMFERDIAVWNSKRYVSSPSYVKSDRSIRSFRQWYSQFYSEQSIPFSEAWERTQSPLDW